MATIPSSEILAELAKHPYKQTDKVQIGGSDHYVKVFVLGTQTPKIIEDSGNPSSIAQACDDILCVGKKGIVVDNTTCYVLKETTPCGTFKRAVVFESSTNAQIVGVVDNDSVQLSTQQGGGIKVASTLPQSGDFVGQICVLTTGSTYVWTGSQWSSTAGSSTLPSATTANKYYGLASTGSGWEAVRGIYCRKGHTSSIADNSVLYYPIGKCRELTSSQRHCAFSGQFGLHNNKSVYIIGDVYVSTSPIKYYAKLNVFDSFGNPSSTMDWKNITMKSDSDGNFYIRVVGNRSSTDGAFFTINKFITDEDDIVLPTTINPIIVTDESTYSDFYEVTVNTTVPVSTASNQMLVSDGNGGWEVRADTLPTPTSSNTYYGLVSTGSAWEANRSVYGRKAQLANVAANAVVYYPLFKMSGQEGVAHGAISGQFGIHNNASFQIFVDVTLWGGTTSMGVLTVLKSYARSNSTVAYNSLSLKIGSDKTVYLRMQGVNSSIDGAFYTINKFIGDSDTVEPSSPAPFIVTDESQYSDLTSYEKHTTVPVSTSANQMLVSDGNGGWKVLEAGTTGQVLTMTSSGIAWASAT